MEQFRVVLSGRVMPGFDAASARTQLAALMRKDEAFAGQLIAGRATTVKSGVDDPTGWRYVKALRAIGIDCRLESDALDFDADIGAAGPRASVPAVPRSPSLSAGIPVRKGGVGAPNPKRSGQARATSGAAETATPLASAADYGLFLLIIPVVAIVLAWFWISGMNLLQGPRSKLNGLMAITILATAIIAAMEASKIGMVSDRAKGSYSPTAWFFIITLFWIVGYLPYLFKRRHYGLANRLVAGLAIAVVLTGTYAILGYAIDAKMAEVQGHLNELQGTLNNLRP